MKRKKWFSAASVPALALAGMIATSAPASATCGGHRWSNPDGTGGSTRGSVSLRIGPHQGCGRTAWVSGYLYYHCYIRNSAGNTWTHVRVPGTQIVGWVWDGNLRDGGSVRYC